MRQAHFSGIGGVVSADIAVPNHARELEFYSKILTTGASPLWRSDLTNNQGTPIIGLGARTAEYEALPLQWMPHFQVADVAASASSAVAMGGDELMHGKTKDGQSQWAVLVDPQGAAFGVIPALTNEAPEARPNGAFGCISWLSLFVQDGSSSSDFYHRVVGWNIQLSKSEQSEQVAKRFEMLIDHDLSVAEIVQVDSEDRDIPPVWMIHLPVGDFTESLGRVRKSGGKVVREFTEAGYAVVQDPAGVYFAISNIKV